MKKETFLKLTKSLIEAQSRRNEFNSKLSDLVMNREGSMREKVDFRDLTCDYMLDDAIIDAIEIEYGEYGRDKFCELVFEKEGQVFDEDIEELHNDILNHIYLI